MQKDGKYCIEYEEHLIWLEDWEAEKVHQHPELVYDILVSRNSGMKRENNMEKFKIQKTYFPKAVRLIQKAGKYCIEYEDRLIWIEDWEAEKVCQHPELVYDIIVSSQLIRKDGRYCIDYEDHLTWIEDWEAEVVRQHPELVYDIIVSHWRKYYFNVAEDSMTR